MYLIYKITNKINNKCYIGKTNNLRLRLNRHKYHVRKKQIDTYMMQ